MKISSNNGPTSTVAKSYLEKRYLKVRWLKSIFSLQSSLRQLLQLYFFPQLQSTLFTSTVKQIPLFPTVPGFLPANVCSCSFLYLKCLMLLNAYHLRPSSPPNQKQYFSLLWFSVNLSQICLVIQLSVYVILHTTLRPLPVISHLEFLIFSTQSLGYMTDS